MDLQNMIIRRKLHSIKNGDRYIIPHAAYTLTLRKEDFYNFVKTIRFHGVYVAKISKIYVLNIVNLDH